MKRHLYRSILSLVLLLFAAGCASNAIPQTGSTAAPTAQPTSAPAAAPTAAAIPSAAPALQPATPSAAATAATAPPIPATGTVTFKIAPGSEANYRVREQLARLNFPSDAVGKTDAISGQISLLPDGTVDSKNSQFTVDVSSLVSDQSMRDRFVGRNVLQTDQFPQVVFTPTKVTGLNGIPQPGEKASFQLTGDLTVRDVTKPVTWDVTGTMNNDGAASVQATTGFTFEDFNLSQPQVPVVLSVVDKITLEVSLQLQKVNP